MFCPNCGIEARQPGQFCRSCGADLRPARNGLEGIDTLTASAMTAREEIAHAIAAKIKELKNAKDINLIAEQTLPYIAEFFETHEEQRLKRMRAGVITAVIGLSVIIFVLMLTENVNRDFFPFIGIGLLPFLIGLGIIINGLLFSMPIKRQPGKSQKALMESILNQPPITSPQKNVSSAPELTSASITEHTTHQLHNETDARGRVSTASHDQ